MFQRNKHECQPSIVIQSVYIATHMLAICLEHQLICLVAIKHDKLKSHARKSQIATAI